MEMLVEFDYEELTHEQLSKLVALILFSSVFVIISVARSHHHFVSFEFELLRCC